MPAASADTPPGNARTAAGHKYDRTFTGDTPFCVTPPATNTATSATEPASTGVSSWTGVVLGSGFMTVLLGASLLIARRTRRA